MSLMLLAAAALTLAIAVVHSVLGERRIFCRLRGGEPRLLAFQAGILWASWHLVSLFGLALAAALFCLASSTGLANLPAVLRGACSLDLWWYRLGMPYHVLPYPIPIRTGTFQWIHIIF